MSAADKQVIKRRVAKAFAKIEESKEVKEEETNWKLGRLILTNMFGGKPEFTMNFLTCLFHRKHEK